MGGKKTAFRGVSLSLRDLLGGDYADAVVGSRSFVSGEGPEAVAARMSEKVDFYPAAFHERMLELLRSVGERVAEPLGSSAAGGTSASFAAASKTGPSPLTGYGLYRVGEDGRPLELFAKHGKAGVCSQAQCEAIGRLASLALRSDVDPRQIEKQLAGITCHAPFGFGPDKVLSCADAIARAMQLDLSHEGRGARREETAHRELSMGACPECGAALTREGHCASCHSCGYTQCA